MSARIAILSVTNFKSRTTEENIKRKSVTSLNYKPPDLQSRESFPTQKNVLSRKVPKTNRFPVTKRPIRVTFQQHNFHRHEKHPQPEVLLRLGYERIGFGYMWA